MDLRIGNMLPQKFAFSFACIVCFSGLSCCSSIHLNASCNPHQGACLALVPLGVDSDVQELALLAVRALALEEAEALLWIAEQDVAKSCKGKDVL